MKSMYCATKRKQLTLYSVSKRDIDRILGEMERMYPESIERYVQEARKHNQQ